MVLESKKGEDHSLTFKKSFLIKFEHMTCTLIQRSVVLALVVAIPQFHN